MSVTKAEREILKDLPAAVRKSFRSKTTLAVLGALDHKGIISFDPFMNSATLTAVGQELVKAE